MKEPLEIQDEEHEQIVARVAAIDVAKATGKVCTRVPHETVPGRRVTKVWDVSATTNAILELGDHLVCQGIEKVTLESTSDYWRGFFYLLEARGLHVQLVNAREVKNVPGRAKTDPLTELRQQRSQLSGRILVQVATFPGCERKRRNPAGSVPLCGAALRVA